MIDDYPVAELLEGLVAAAVALLAARTQPESVRRPLLAVVALSSAVAWAFDLAPARLGLAAVAALVLSLSSDRPVRLLGAFIAAGALATTLPASLGASPRLAALAAVAVVAALLADRRADGREAAVVVLGAATVGGILALPDTERITFVCGVMAAVVAATVSSRRWQATTVGLVLLGAEVVWAGAVDARGRPAAFVAVLAPLGLLVSLAVSARFSRRPPLPVVALVAVGLAGFAGRVAGLRADVGEAVLLGGVGALIGVGLVVAAAFLRPPVSGPAGARRSRG